MQWRSRVWQLQLKVVTLWTFFVHFKFEIFLQINKLETTRCLPKGGEKCNSYRPLETFQDWYKKPYINEYTTEPENVETFHHEVIGETRQVHHSMMSNDNKVRWTKSGSEPWNHLTRVFPVLQIRQSYWDQLGTKYCLFSMKWSSQNGKLGPHSSHSNVFTSILELQLVWRVGGLSRLYLVA